mmetsp:Transcript_165436/g.525816  ORF Transcript_165436/g.525816 Transcript_165436/m.525816 type:complete len:167 (-) Transcript_165436:69-569(-)
MPLQHMRPGVVWALLCAARCRRHLRALQEHEQWRKENGEADERFEAMVTAREVRECPNCKHGVYKDEGCNHMTCRCQHHFCYVCNESLDPLNPYVHYSAPGAKCHLFDGQEAEDAGLQAGLQAALQRRRRQRHRPARPADRWAGAAARAVWAMPQDEEENPWAGLQ